MKYLIAIAAVLATTAYGHEGATGVIKERMDSMSALGNANKTLSSMSRGRAPFDLNLVVQSASVLQEQAGNRLLAMFPEGSMSEVSEAKMSIWENWEDFSAISLELEAAALNLSNVESEDEFKTIYRQVSKTCSACHRQYRAKK